MARNSPSELKNSLPVPEVNVADEISLEGLEDMSSDISDSQSVIVPVDETSSFGATSAVQPEGVSLDEDFDFLVTVFNLFSDCPCLPGRRLAYPTDMSCHSTS